MRRLFFEIFGGDMEEATVFIGPALFLSSPAFLALVPVPGLQLLALLLPVMPLAYSLH